jgi:hypothetical protein
MFTRYTHGHSIAVGCLLGILLAQHVFVIACVALAAGIAMGRSWGWLEHVARGVRARINRP